MKVLVTGAGGFIGKHIADFLFAKGYEVTGILHKSNQKFGFPTIQADLTKPWGFAGKFDVIVHAAGKTPQRKGIKREYERQWFKDFKTSNIDCMEQLITYAEKTNVKRIINLSTIGVYGQIREAVINENSDLINLDTYGVTKYIGECLLHDANSIEHINLRMPGVVSADSRNIWFTNTVERFQKNEDVTIYAPDFQTRNFVWLPDLCNFIEHLLDLPAWKYEYVNIACHQTASVREIVERMRKLTKSHSSIIVNDSVLKPFCLDDSRAVEMGYESISPISIVNEYCRRYIN